MNREIFMRELNFLLQDINDEERTEALNYYQDYFDEAGIENEQAIINELSDPSRVAAMIKDGLKGTFDDHIEVGNQGFSNEDYKRSYEVIDSKTTSSTTKSLKEKWHNMVSRDKFILILILILAVVPLSFPLFGVFKGIFRAGFLAALAFACVFFGFWIITFILYFIAIAFIVCGMTSLFSLPGAGLIYMGVGCILIGIGTVFGKIASWFFKDCIPKIIDGISSLFNRIFGNRGMES